MPYLVDSHCHLNYPEFVGKLDDVVQSAFSNNVKIMQTICTKISEFDEVLEIAKKYKNIYASVGIHPHYVDSEKISEEKLIKLAETDKVIGIGETGLDYYYENSPRDLQKESFITHISAARKTNLPIIIHTRDADADTIEILKNEMKKGEFKILIHCFTASKELADIVLNLGGYISLSGILTFKNAKELQETVKNIPLERILVETDSPFLAPIPHRGKNNQPSYTKYVAEFLAELKNTSFAEVEKITTENFFKLFNKAKLM